MSISVVINAHEWNSTFFRGLKYVNSGVEGAHETLLMAGELRGSAGRSCSRPQQVQDAQGGCEATEGTRGGSLGGFGSVPWRGCSPAQLVSAIGLFFVGSLFGLFIS